MGDAFEVLAFFPEDGEGIEGLFGEAGGFLYRFIEAEDGGVGGFGDRFIFPGCFAQLLGRLGDVEDVVDDLEGEAEVVAEDGEGLELARGGVGGHAAKAQGGREEGGCFVFVNANELGLGEIFALTLKVEHLSADELFGAPALGEFEEDILEWVAFGGRGVGEDGEGFGQEGIANEHGHAFSVDFVGSRAAAAEVVVIHAGEVIVHQRIGVHDFDGAGRREGVRDVTSASLGCRKGEDGAEALAAGEDGVSHALVNGLGSGGHAREKPVQGIVDEDLLACEISFEIGHLRETNRNFR